MNELQLYKRLQAVVGDLNRVAAELYSGGRTAPDALAEVKPIIDSLKTAVDAEV